MSLLQYWSENVHLDISPNRSAPVVHRVFSLAYLLRVKEPQQHTQLSQKASSIIQEVVSERTQAAVAQRSITPAGMWGASS